MLELVKELRERTGAGMADCKKALAETNNNIDEAIKFLREKGLAQAAKKAGRIAAEGVCNVLVAGNTGMVVEVNIETDFAAKADRFVEFVGKVSNQILNGPANTVEALMAEKWVEDANLSVEEAVKGAIAVIGENINIRRFTKIEKKTPGILCSYIHGGGKIAVLVDLEAEQVNEGVHEAGKNICLQIAALLPRFTKVDDVPEEFKAAEMEIITNTALNENAAMEKPRPEKVMMENVIPGRFAKYMKEICLMDQEYVKDGSLTVAKYLDVVSKELGFKVSVNRFVCFERGEGIEKKQENFAEEVAKVTGN
ncbi:MAG: translation elongation factor Ts [Defluviitaleaceae bacterium]|nr:translation elongation factor Ts [Defluviitaleaceae bacterium]